MSLRSGPALRESTRIFAPARPTARSNIDLGRPAGWALIVRNSSQGYESQSDANAVRNPARRIWPAGEAFENRAISWLIWLWKIAPAPRTIGLWLGFRNVLDAQPVTT